MTDTEAIKDSYINAGARESKLSDFIGSHVLNTAPIAITGGYAIGIDGRTHVLLEDMNDGYRSNMECVLTLDGLTDLLKGAAVVNRQVVGYYPHDPNGCRKSDDLEASNDDVVCFLDRDNGHIWLSIGTEKSASFYPCFIAVWQPMKEDSKTPCIPFDAHV